MKEVLLADLLSGALSRESPDPLQKQIYDIVRRGVLDHTLVAGQRLPSSRVLAQELGISRITVTLAYERLIAENYLSARGGSGTFVEKTVDRPLLPPASPEHVQRHVPGLSTRGEGIAGGAAGLGQHTGAFVPGVADASLFPFHLWRRLVSRHLGKSNLALSGYAKDGAGFLPLREGHRQLSAAGAGRGVRAGAGHRHGGHAPVGGPVRAHAGGGGRRRAGGKPVPLGLSAGAGGGGRARPCRRAR